MDKVCRDGVELVKFCNCVCKGSPLICGGEVLGLRGLCDASVVIQKFVI